MSGKKIIADREHKNINPNVRKYYQKMQRKLEKISLQNPTQRAQGECIERGQKTSL